MGLVVGHTELDGGDRGAVGPVGDRPRAGARTLDGDDLGAVGGKGLVGKRCHRGNGVTGVVGLPQSFFSGTDSLIPAVMLHEMLLPAPAVMVGLPANAGVADSATALPAANDTASAVFMMVLNMSQFPPGIVIRMVGLRSSRCAVNVTPQQTRRRPPVVLAKQSARPPWSQGTATHRWGGAQSEAGERSTC